MNIVQATGCVASLLLCVGLGAAGDARSSWPDKGDTIFISFTLAGVIQEPIPSLARRGLAYDPPVPHDRKVCRQAKFCWYYIPPCEPLRVYGSKQSKLRLDLEDSYSAHQRLEGDFTPWLHRSQQECSASLGTPPKPRLRFRNYALALLAAEEIQAPDKFGVSVGGPLKPAGVVEIDATPPEPPETLSHPQSNPAVQGDKERP